MINKKGILVISSLTILVLLLLTTTHIFGTKKAEESQSPEVLGASVAKSSVATSLPQSDLVIKQSGSTTVTADSMRLPISFYSKFQCADKIDNDGDGLIDYPNDPGCDSPTDTDETNKVNPGKYQCNNLVDDDGDNLVDAADPGCHSDNNANNPASYVPTDNDEVNKTNCTDKCIPPKYQCSDGIDNDGDALIDAADPGCHSDNNANNPASYVPTDNDEYNYTAPVYQCSDGVDNDGDALIDTADPGCHSDNNANNPASYVPTDNDETNIPPTLSCTINSFIVPASAMISANTVTVSWTTTNCDTLRIDAYSGSGVGNHYYPTVSQASSGSITMPVYDFGLSTSDSSLDLSIMAANNTNVVSVNKTIPIIDVSNPPANQCLFSSVAATPIQVAAGQSTTLNWSAPDGCVVFIVSWTRTSAGVSQWTYIWNSPTPWYPSIGSKTLTVNQPTVYYITAQTQDGYTPTHVASSKTISVNTQ